MVDLMLYFGSFNPIHKGHIAIAEYLLQENYCKKLFLVISPQNPFKNQGDLLPEVHRSAMAKIASKSNTGISVCEVEFTMPRPSYSIDTILKIRELYPDKTLGLLMGGDNLVGLSKWKNIDKIVELCSLFVYPRGSFSLVSPYDFTELKDAPLFDVSSTEIREKLHLGEDCSKLLDPEVESYIKNNYLCKENTI